MLECALALTVALSGTPASATTVEHAAAVKLVTASIVTLSDSTTYDRFFDAIRMAVGDDVAVEVSDEASRATREDVATGIVIDADGHLVTTASFAARASKIRARLASGERDDVAIVGFDAASDLAVLRLAHLRPPPVVLGLGADALATAQAVCIVGAGPGTDCTVSQGTLRQVRLHLDAGRLHDYLYLDAEASPGTAGAAVVAGNGTVIGMVSLRMLGRGTLALPAPTIHHIAKAIIESRDLPRPTLGVTVFTPAIPRAQERGVHIGGVVPDSPAAAVGIQPGDVILEFDGNATDDVATLKSLVRQSQPDQKVTLLFRRGSERHRASVRLAPGTVPAPSGRIVVRIATTYLGLELENPDPSATDREGVPPGALVRSVDTGSPAAIAGVRVGDLVTRVARDPVLDANTLHRLVSDRSQGETVELELVRDRHTMIVQATLALRTRIASLPQKHYMTELAESSDGVESSTPDIDSMLNTVRQGIDRYRKGVVSPP